MDISKLRRISFKKVLILENEECVDTYCYSEFVKKGRPHKISEYCISCEEKDCNILKNNEVLSLMSYGTHTMDYLQYLKYSPEDNKLWHDEGVMFLFENPGEPWKRYNGLDDEKGMYRTFSYQGYNKRPMINSWSWIGWDDKTKISDFDYPKCFKQKNYGSLILSIILLFKLKNAYVTNAVKCGTDTGKNTENYRKETIVNCTNNILADEIETLNPKIIFAFGDRTFKIAKKQLERMDNNNIELIKLPHPGSRKSNEELKKCYSGDILNVLYENNIIKNNEYENLNILFER